MHYRWAVIGAGPAGIAAIGKLIDQGIANDKILWIDPEFKGGDFGTIWRNVPSNTKVGLFIKFLEAVKAFNYQNCPIDFELNGLAHDQTCQLNLMADPLQWVTEQLKNKVHCIEGIANELSLAQRTWHIKIDNKQVTADCVILATGAVPKNLDYATSIIPLEMAMDSSQITNYIHPNDTIAVFGSSHSAILVLRNLVENHVKQIINFYRSPLVYAVYLKEGILFDNTGLKGLAAEWARVHIDGELPDNLMRIVSNQKNLTRYLPECNKVIYAVGFEKRKLPRINNLDKVDYDVKSGIIAPGLFGLGIAYPELHDSRFGIAEYQVGLWKFMDYLERVLPLWLNYSA